MARRVIIDLPSAGGQLLNQGGCVLFYGVRETTGAAAAAARFFDGVSTAGKLILPVGLASGASTSSGFVCHAVPFRQGLFYEVVAGALEGAVSVLLQHQCDEYWAVLEGEIAQVLHPGAPTPITTG